MNRFTCHAAAVAVGLFVLCAPGAARAQSDPFVGQLQQFATVWCPSDWARADGSLISISENAALYSLIGTQFGGDGVTTLALPDLRDRSPVGMSVAAPLGTVAGQASTTLTNAQLPIHVHGFNADPTPPVSNSPADSMMGLFPVGQPIYAPPSATPDTPMNARLVAPAGGSQPMPTQMPALATNWCIALNGIYPQRP